MIRYLLRKATAPPRKEQVMLGDKMEELFEEIPAPEQSLWDWLIHGDSNG